MSTFVLVHGAWQSAATWDLVVPILQRTGHDVCTPALTGLGPTSEARLTPAVTLRTHIDDVLRVIECGALRDVWLVGHSYAGMVVTGVAERARDHLAGLTYVDAFIPDHGTSALELMPVEMQTMFREQAAEPANDGFRLRAGERHLDLWGLEPGPARDFVRARLCDFSIRCFEEPLELPTGAAATLPRAYISCVREGYPARAVFERFARRAQTEGWRHDELPTGHDCHVETPDRFCALITAAEAAGRNRETATGRDTTAE
jgi:pimeloyl-ACP methyl ester carboxylesterase